MTDSTTKPTLLTYVIHLKGSPRRQNIEHQKQMWGLKDLRYFDAVNGKSLNIRNLIHSGLMTKHPRIIKEAMANMGSVGCYLSHSALLKRLYEELAPNGIGMILEDDFKITPHWQLLGDFLHNVPPDWDMLYLGYNKFVGKPFNHCWGKCAPTAIDHYGANSGAWAYLVRRESIPKILSETIPIRSSVFRDNALRPLLGSKINAYFANVKLIVHQDLQGSERKTIDRTNTIPGRPVYKVIN